VNPQILKVMDPPLPAAPLLDRNGYPLPPGAISRLGSVRFRHGGYVSHMAYTPNGKAIATTSQDGFMRLWEAVTGKLRWRYGFAKSLFWEAFAISGDGKKLAVHTDLEYAVVAADTGKVLSRVKWMKAEDNERVSCVAIAPDLGTLARGCSDATVRLCETASGEERLRFSVGEKVLNEMPLEVEFSADGKVLFVVAYQKPGVMVFDTATGKLIRTLGTEIVERPILLGSPNSRLFATESRPVTRVSRVALWDVTTAKQLHVFEQRAVGLAAFSPDSSRLAICLANNDVVLIDSDTGKEQVRFAFPSNTYSLAFAPDGKTLASGGTCITVGDLTTGKLLLPTPAPVSRQEFLQFQDGGSQLRTQNLDDGFYWWNVMSGQLTRYLPRDPAWTSYALAESISSDGKLRAAFTHHLGDDGKIDKVEILLVDTATKQIVRTMAGHTSFILQTVFSPDGTKLFSVGGYDPRVLVWDVATGKLLHELKSHARFANHVAVSPDGRWLASWSQLTDSPQDRDIRLWDVENGKLVHRLGPQAQRVSNAVFSSDSSKLVSVGYVGTLPANAGGADLWDLATGKLERTFTGALDHGGCAALTPDCRMLATAGDDNTIRLWDVATGAERGRIAGHESQINALDFSPNGKLLAAASCEAPVYIWDVFGLEKAKGNPALITQTDRDKLWHNLAATDAAIGFQAICELVARPDEAVTLLKDGWMNLPRATPMQMQKWVEDLNSNQFAVRKSATAELDRFAFAHGDLLHKALEQAGSLEVRQRLEAILRRLDPERLRLKRMLEVLERLGTAQPPQFLKALAAQTEDTELAREAAKGLKRLEKR
jgi:WD40 repeat protein